MAATSRQKRIEGRVMHEFEHGELKSGPGGKAGPVKSRKQAIAIALSEAGASRYKSRSENERSLSRTKGKEAKDETAQQEREGWNRLGADRQRESTPALGGKEAWRPNALGAKSAAARARIPDGRTLKELKSLATRRNLAGRSRMSKRQLENALGVK